MRKNINGWRLSKDGAVQDQIDASTQDAIDRAKRNLPKGSSRTKCEDCGEKIPVARQKTLKGIRLCVSCQEEVDREEITSLSINRSANKDSQLR